MAVTKKAAKKAVPKVVEQPKQIILTEDQYDELVNIQWGLNRICNRIKSISTDNDYNQKETAFEFGILSSEMNSSWDKMKNVLDDIDPNPLPDWGDDDNDYDSGYN